MNESPAILHADKPVILVGGGRLDTKHLCALASCFAVVGVDSGADTVAALGIEPVLITGDFDSIACVDNFAQDRIIPTPDQGQTDFAKALSCLTAPVIIGLGFLGRRLDHTLGAVHVLANTDKAVVLVDRYDTVFFSRDAITLALKEGDRVSIWPLMQQRFIGSQGLEWPLDGLEMNPKDAIGTSNKVVSHDGIVKIIPDEGSGYLVIVGSECLASVLDVVAPEWSGQIAQLFNP